MAQAGLAIRPPGIRMSIRSGIRPGIRSGIRPCIRQPRWLEERHALLTRRHGSVWWSRCSSFYTLLPYCYVRHRITTSHHSCAHRIAPVLIASLRRTSTVTATLLYLPHLYHHRTTTLHRSPALKCRLYSTTTVHGVLLLYTARFYCTRHVSTL